MVQQKETLYILDDVAKELGCDRDTIRRWEEQGKLPFRVKRDPNGWRRYTRKDIEMLKKFRKKLHPPIKPVKLTKPEKKKAKKAKKKK
jgi:DNA-binding transcriptional MerR regulator